MSDLPPGWVHVYVDDIKANSPNALAIGPFGSNLKVSDYREAGVPLVFVRNIRARAFSIGDLKFASTAKAESLRPHHVKQGDLLVTKMGDPPGDVAIYPLVEEGIITADCIKLTAHPSVNVRYLLYALGAPAVKRQIIKITQGVAQPKMSLDRFRHGVQLPLAPSAEQDRIVAAIEEQFSRLDAGVAALERVRQNLKRLRITLMQAAVLGRVSIAVHDIEATLQQTSSGVIPLKRRAGRLWGSGSVPQLTEQERASIPEHWQWSKVSELGSDPDGTVQVGPMSMRSADFITSGIPVLNVGSVQWDWIDESKLNYLPPASAESFSRYRIQPGDVLFTRSGTVGRAAVAETRHRDWLMTFHLLRVRPDQNICLPEYLRMVFEAAPHVRRQARGAAIGTTRAGFNTRLLAELDVPLPPLHEQIAIVRTVQLYLSQMDGIDSSVWMNVSRALRSSILTAAFSGKLVPQDSNDEPAAALLERIATERASATGNNRARIRKPRVPQERIVV
jgi:type I restriction enzyme, S subunit